MMRFPVVAAALALAACSSDSGPPVPIPPVLEVSLQAVREPPLYPFQPVRFTVKVQGRSGAGTLLLEGPGGFETGGGLAGSQLIVLPQIPGEWTGRVGVLSGACSPTLCVDRVNLSNPVIVEVVGHEIVLASLTGHPGSEAADLKFTGAAAPAILRILDEGGAPVTEVPLTENEWRLDPGLFSRPGLVYYLQVVSGSLASSQFHPVWVPRPETQPALDFGRGGFMFSQGRSKRILIGSPGYFGSISLREMDGPRRETVSVSPVQQEVELRTPVTGRVQDELWQLEVRLQRSLAASPTTFSALVVVLGQR